MTYKSFTLPCDSALFRKMKGLQDFVISASCSPVELLTKTINYAYNGYFLVTKVRW